MRKLIRGVGLPAALRNPNLVPATATRKGHLIVADRTIAAAERAARPVREGDAGLPRSPQFSELCVDDPYYFYRLVTVFERENASTSSEADDHGGKIGQRATHVGHSNDGNEHATLLTHASP